jgi:putative flippase GtrA
MRPQGTRPRSPRNGSPRRATAPLERLVLLLRARADLFGQGIRFALTGAVVALVYLTTTTVLSEVLGMPFQAALAIGFCAGLVLHFTLQRVFVWAHHEEFALSLRHQVGRYLLVACVQYGVTAASTSLLPSALGLPTELVYLVTFMLTVVANFLVFRNGVFHGRPGELESIGTVEI